MDQDLQESEAELRQQIDPSQAGNSQGISQNCRETVLFLPWDW